MPRTETANPLVGVFSVLPTPFAADGSVDVRSLERVIDLYLRAGVDGLTALGVTSEASRLSESERHLVLGTVMRHVAGAVPVIAGTSADGADACIAYTREAREQGVAAVMISPPRMAKLNSDAVVRHYAAVAAAVDIPVVIQDFPPASGFAMEPELLVRIARDVPAARTVKLEDPPTPPKIARVLEQAPDLSILGGLGGTYLFEELAAGAAGTMTGFAVPELLVRIVRLYREGTPEAAADYFHRRVSLMRFEFQEGVGMAIRKEILRRRGALATAATRAPAARPDASTLRSLDMLLTWFRNEEKDFPWTLA